VKKSILNSDTFSPLYRQLMQRLKSDIASGVYPVHGRIPSEQELCEAYQVSRVTVRKALLDLVKDGLLIRHQGKGTFVAVPRIQRDLRQITSFHAACRIMGCTASTKLIHLHWQHAAPEDVENLHVEPGEMVLEMCRLRYADNLPVMLETNHFPAAFSYLTQQDLTQSLYDILLRNGAEPNKAVHDIALSYAAPAQAKLLEVEPGTALLLLNECVYDQSGAPIHTSSQLIRGDRFTFRI
jgi:GntR family transcriptional regulator